MLKRSIGRVFDGKGFQPPSGGCVLKHNCDGYWKDKETQPPSGGCVLKPIVQDLESGEFFPAAFGRLCVETCMAVMT